MRLRKGLGLLLGLLVLSTVPVTAKTAQSCNPHFPGWQPTPPGNASEPQMIGFQTRAATAKIAQDVGMPQKLPGPILATAPVNLQNLQQKSALGYLIRSEAAGCLAQLGFTVQDNHSRPSFEFIQGKAQSLTLSPQGQERAQKSGAQAILVGTYLKRSNGAHITLKLLHISNNQILGAVSYWLKPSPKSHKTN